MQVETQDSSKGFRIDSCFQECTWTLIISHTYKWFWVKHNVSDGHFHILGEIKKCDFLKRPINHFLNDNITLQNICFIRGKSLQKPNQIFVLVNAAKHYLSKEMQKKRALGHLFIISNFHLIELI